MDATHSSFVKPPFVPHAWRRLRATDDQPSLRHVHHILLPEPQPVNAARPVNDRHCNTQARPTSLRLPFHNDQVVPLISESSQSSSQRHRSTIYLWLCPDLTLKPPSPVALPRNEIASELETVYKLLVYFSRASAQSQVHGQREETRNATWYQFSEMPSAVPGHLSRGSRASAMELVTWTQRETRAYTAKVSTDASTQTEQAAQVPHAETREQAVPHHAAPDSGSRARCDMANPLLFS